MQFTIQKKRRKEYRLKNKIKLAYFALIVSFINLGLYHLPLFKFTAENLDYKSLDGLFTLVSVAIILLILNALIFYNFLKRDLLRPKLCCDFLTYLPKY